MPIYNLKVTEYKDSVKITHYNNPVVYDEDKNVNENDSEEKEKNSIPADPERSMKVSMNRTKNMIYDLSKSNDWDWFVTFTFNPEKVDSTNYDECLGCIKKFVDKLRKRGEKKFKYMLVPEFHADGKKFHFHGLFANLSFELFEKSEHNDHSGNMIYNIPDWNYGFSTATLVEDNQKVSAYITKYITKDCVFHTKRKKRYLVSKNIDRPKVDKINSAVTLEDILKTVPFDYLSSVNVSPAHRKVTYIETQKKRD